MKKTNQSGRSMIEMLGVLAIIGVLTVGSITGYSHAMRRHLLNRQAEQISYILSAAKIDLNQNLDLPYNMTSIFETFGWVPKEMIKGSSAYIYDVFHNQVSLRFVGSSLSIYIQLQKNSHDQCTNLLQNAKKLKETILQTGVSYKNSQGSLLHKIFDGDHYCNQTSSPCINDVSLAEISQICHICNNSSSCQISILWR